MAPVLAARVLLASTFAAVLAVGGVAHADQRPVAVVDLEADDAEVRQLAIDVDKALRVHDVLEPIDSDSDAALHDALSDEDQPTLEAARRGLASVQDLLAQFQLPATVREATAASDSLDSVTPRAAMELRAELTLVRGIALLGDAKPALAAEAFGLIHHLTPDLVLDPARYLPEVVDAFKHATPSTDTRLVDIKGSGRVWVDGREVGAAPGSFEMTIGLHVVQLVGPERMTRGREVRIDSSPAVANASQNPATLPGRPVVTILDVDARPAVRVHRARLALAQAGDAFGRAGAMRYLAGLVHVSDAIVLSRNPQKVIVAEIWSADHGFAAARPVGAGTGTEPPSKLVDVISPPKPKKPKDPVVKYPVKIADAPPWYEQRWVIPGGVATLVVGIVVAGYFASTYEGTVMYDGKVGGAPQPSFGWNGTTTGATKRR